MRKILTKITIGVLLAFALSTFTVSMAIQSAANSTIDRVIGKLEQDKKQTVTISERKIRKIYDCVSISNCSETPKSIETIQTIANLDYIIEKDGKLISPPDKLSFDMSGMDENILLRYELVEIDSPDPRYSRFNYSPRKNLGKAKSNTEQISELTSGEMTIDRNDFGIVSMNSRLIKPISFSFLFIKVFSIYEFDIQLERERIPAGFYVTTHVTAYTEFQRIFSTRKKERHEIILVRAN